MRSWFEFGYDGFPKGAQRRRFYQQRDDPCDSEEERDNDDESGDRPVLHLPLPKYSASSTSSSASSLSSDEDNSEHLCAPTALMSTTVNDTTPSRYGASVVTAAGAVGPTQLKRYFVVEHGGVCIASQRVLNDFCVAEVTSPKSRHAALAHHVPAVLDPQLSDRFSWDALHPGLVADAVAGEAAQMYTQPPYRYGHCAIALPEYSPADAALRLSRPRDAAWCQSTTGTTASHSTGHVSPARCSETTPSASSPRCLLPAASLLHPTDQDVVSLSLILGGASSSMHSSSSLNGGFPTSLLGAVRNVGPPRDTGGARALNDPQLVVTLVAASHAPAVPSRYTSRCFPLAGSSSLYLPARVFASLSLWPSSVKERDLGGACGTHRVTSTSSPSTSSQPCTHRFAYLGGSLNGRQPIPLFGVTLLELNATTWSLHHTVLETYGTEPPSRFAHSATVWGQQLYVFGGVGHNRAVLNDLFVLDTDTLVWREVFIPSNYDVPRRAFHSAVVVPSRYRQRRKHSAVRIEAVPWTRDTFSEGVRNADDEADGETTTAAERSGGDFSLLLLGGESLGGAPVPEVWSVDLGNHEWRHWQLHTLRCRGVVDSREEPTASVVFSPSAPCSRTSTPSPDLNSRPTPALARLRRVLRTLAEKEAERSRAVSLGAHTQRISSHRSAVTTALTMENTTDHLSTHYVSAFFGALGTAVILNTEGSDEGDITRGNRCAATWHTRSTRHHSVADAVSVLLWGGTHSPPVQVLSQLDLPDECVRMQCCLWLCSSATVHSPVITQFGPLLYRLLPSLLRADLPWPPLRQRTPHCPFARGGDDSQNEEYAGEHHRTPSSLSQQAVEIGNQAAMEGQLADWHRAARRRLRDQ